MTSLSRRRLLALAGGVGLGGLGLSGCSSVLPAPDTAAPGFGEGATGTVRVWCRAATQEGLTSLVEAFNASQDRLTVELTPVLDAQYVTKLATAIRGREVPDLVDIDDINSMLFIYRDAFTDLTDLVAALPYADELSPGHLGLATREGRVYGAPYLADNSLLWFNLDLCEAAGVDPDVAVQGFDQLLDAARALRGLGPDTYAWSFPGNSPGALGFVVQPMVWAAETDFITGEVGVQRGAIEGNEAVRAMLELHRTMWTEDLVAPTSFADDASRWGSDFRGGRIGIFPTNYSVAVSSAEGDFAERITSRLLPGPDGGGAFFDGGDNMCIPRGARNASGAWEFVRFALDLPQQFALPAGGYTPVRADVADERFRETYPHASVPLDDIEAGYAPTTLAYNLIYNQPDGPWLKMFRRAVFDGDLDGAIAEGQEGWDAILSQAQA
ncbi:extracellular solute-binding protein [Auraticoccus monumenti]|uniref:Carbohydrate ABC transporter substrate-binding protein, CUT1 family n=1 Tax=Auraticoccus monumenti TaxID=675864 RepID=A0A1G6VNC0_9ACTN|nr:extracellular solute-binding protein [Auraticoccus monumenti]SDD54903.1 carbohydrate ABC transporter substrate-binding protein, CUT1 family [Auraticoccus monumenti]